MRGFFITFEGIEGCGKSTQTRLLLNCLTARGYKVLLTREPGDGEIGDKIRQILLSTATLGLQPNAELFLLAADRSQHVTQTILPALHAGKIVISDRYADSSVAYQAFARGIPLEHVQMVNHIATQGLCPDLTILMDLDVHTSLTRSRYRLFQQEMYNSEGRFENENMVFHQKVRNGYLDLTRLYPKRMVIVDGNAPIDAIAESIFNIVHPQILHRFHDSDSHCRDFEKDEKTEMKL